MRVKDLLSKIVSVHFITIELCARYRVFGELTETNVRKWECNANLMRLFDEDDRWLLSEEVDGIIIYDTTLKIYIKGEVSEC